MLKHKANKHYIALTFAILLGTLISLSSSYLYINYENRLEELEIKNELAGFLALFKQNMVFHLDTLYGFDSIYKLSSQLDTDVFQTLTEDLILRHPTVRRLGWTLPQTESKQKLNFKYIESRNTKFLKHTEIDLSQHPKLDIFVKRAVHSQKIQLFEIDPPLFAEDKQAAFLAIFPMRRSDGQGMILAQFNLRGLLKSIAEQTKDDYNFSLYFINQKKENKFYQSQGLCRTPTLSQRIKLNDQQSLKIEGCLSQRSKYMPYLPVLVFLLAGAICLLLFGLLFYLASKISEHKQASLSDSLTQLPNRKAFEQKIDHLLTQSRKNNEPLSLLMIDIDHFKQFNDNHGHLAGDQCLVSLGQVILEFLTQNEQLFAARYGGEEFVMLFPNTPGSLGYKIAENLRQRVAHLKVPLIESNQFVTITLSIGLYTYNPQTYKTPKSWKDALQLADEALYQAKQTGRNKVLVYNTHQEKE